MFDLKLEVQEKAVKQPTLRGIVNFTPEVDAHENPSGYYIGHIEFKYLPNADERVRYINKKLPDGSFQKTDVVNNAKKGLCIIIDNNCGEYRFRGTANLTASI